MKSTVDIHTKEIGGGVIVFDSKHQGKPIFRSINNVGNLFFGSVIRVIDSLSKIEAYRWSLYYQKRILFRESQIRLQFVAKVQKGKDFLSPSNFFALFYQDLTMSLGRSMWSPFTCNPIFSFLLQPFFASFLVWRQKFQFQFPFQFHYYWKHVTSNPPPVIAGCQLLQI